MTADGVHCGLHEMICFPKSGPTTQIHQCLLCFDSGWYTKSPRGWYKCGNSWGCFCCRLTCKVFNIERKSMIPEQQIRSLITSKIFRVISSSAILFAKELFFFVIGLFSLLASSSFTFHEADNYRLWVHTWIAIQDRHPW